MAKVEVQAQKLAIEVRAEGKPGPDILDADRRRARTAGAARRTPMPDFAAADAFIWQPQGSRLAPVPRVNRVEMALLKGIDRVRDTLVENTERFAKGLPANNALLWGARGMGKSSLVKAVACRGQRQRRRKTATSSSSKSTARTSRACRT